MLCYDPNPFVLTVDTQYTSAGKQPSYLSSASSLKVINHTERARSFLLAVISERHDTTDIPFFLRKVAWFLINASYLPNEYYRPQFGTTCSLGNQNRSWVGVPCKAFYTCFHTIFAG